MQWQVVVDVSMLKFCMYGCLMIHVVVDIAVVRTACT